MIVFFPSSFPWRPWHVEQGAFCTQLRPSGLVQHVISENKNYNLVIWYLRGSKIRFELQERNVPNTVYPRENASKGETPQFA